MTDITAAGVVRARRPHRKPHGLRRHAACRPGRVRPAEGPRRRGRRSSRGRGRRGRPHRHQRLLWPPRDQSDHPRGAASLPCRPCDRHQAGRACAARTRHGIPRSRLRTSSVASTTISGTSRSMPWTWSTCGSAACSDRWKARSRAPFLALVELQRQGLIRHLEVSNVTPDQFREASGIAKVVCVQNYYNVAHRDDDDFIDDLAAAGVAYVPFFPLGGFSPLQSSTSRRSRRLGATPMQTALAWLLHRAPNVADSRHVLAAHLREKISPQRSSRCHRRRWTASTRSADDTP